MARLGPEVLDELPGILAGRRERVLAEMADHDAASARADPYLTLAERHVMQHAVHRLRAELEWLDTVLSDLPQIITDEQTREVD